MTTQKHHLGDTAAVLAALFSCEPLCLEQATDLRVARAWKPKFTRESAHAAVDLGHRLARIVEHGECRYEPLVDPRCRLDHARIIAAEASRL